jgi:hypothetical protein
MRPVMIREWNEVVVLPFLGTGEVRRVCRSCRKARVVGGDGRQGLCRACAGDAQKRSRAKRARVLVELWGMLGVGVRRAREEYEDWEDDILIRFFGRGKGLMECCVMLGRLHTSVGARVRFLELMRSGDDWRRWESIDIGQFEGKYMNARISRAIGYAEELRRLHEGGVVEFAELDKFCGGEPSAA